MYQSLLTYFIDLGTLSADFTELLTVKFSLYIASRSIRGDSSRGFSELNSALSFSHLN